MIAYIFKMSQLMSMVLLVFTQLSCYGRRAFCVAGPSVWRLEFPDRQLAESGYWQEEFETISEDVSVRNILMHSVQ